MKKLELLQRFSKLPTGNIADAMSALNIPCKTVPGLYPLSPDQPRAVGYAVTIQQMARNINQDEKVLTKHSTVIDEMLGQGDLLVIDVDGKTDPCTGGALLALRASMLGISGFLINGCLRDLREIRALGFPVYLKGGSPIKSSPALETVGVNVPIEINGTQISPGDVIIMDDTGVVLVPAKHAHEICKRAEEICNFEQNEERLIRLGHSINEAFLLAANEPHNH